MSRLARLLTHDFLPGASARVRQRVATPVGCLAAAALVAVACGLVVHPRVFALAGGLAAVIAVGVWWPWVTARGVRAEVRFGRDRVTEGEPVTATAAVVNYLPWPAWGLALRGLDGGAAAVRLGGAAGRAETHCTWVFTPPCRGEYPAAAPRLASGFPFGLWEAGRAVAVPGQLLVWPRTYPVGPVPAADGSDAVEGNVARSRAGTDGEVLGVRPYRRGDSPRRIHWGQSAKHDRLIVCELQSTSRPVVWLVIDADPAVHTGGPDGSREWAIRVAASFARGWLGAGALVGIAWDGTVVAPAAGGAQLVRVMDALARLPAGGRPLADVLRSPALAAVRGGVRVVVTSDAGAERARAAARDGVRLVVLDRTGFPDGTPEPRQPTCDEGPVRPPPRAWLTMPAPGRVPALLRHGWAEARHGA